MAYLDTTPMTGEEFNAARERGDVATQPGRTDHTWQGPDTSRPRPAMTGLEFDTTRRESAEARDAAPKMSAMNRISRGDFSAIVGELEALIARCQKLEGQISVLQQQVAGQNPPHLRKVEKRTA